MLFHKGDGPLVSVLVATRGRHERLLKAVSSVWTTATNPAQIEFVFKADSDDEATVATLCNVTQQIPSKLVVSPRGSGMMEQHRWLDTMAAVATGDWLFIFSDDAEMVTKGWDEKLRFISVFNTVHQDPEVALLFVRSAPGKNDCPWVFLRRTVYKVLGRLSATPMADQYLHNVMTFLKSSYEFPLEITHRGEEWQEDQTQADVKKTYKVNEMNEVGRDLFRIQEQYKDIAKLMKYMRKRGTLKVR